MRHGYTRPRLSNSGPIKHFRRTALFALVTSGISERPIGSYSGAALVVVMALSFDLTWAALRWTRISLCTRAPDKTPPSHTGNSALRRPSPERSTSMPIYGPTTGAFLAKPAIVPRKSPKSTAMPYNSTQKPMSGHRRRMRARPPKKAAVPLAFCFRAKKRSVFCGPMMMVRPMRNRIWRYGARLEIPSVAAAATAAESKEGTGGLRCPSRACQIRSGQHSHCDPMRRRRHVTGLAVRLTWPGQRRA